MKANSAAAEVLQLPLLPLFQAVLLPGGFVRVLIPQSWRKSAALVHHLLSQQGEVYVAAVPYLGKVADEDMVDEHLDLEKLYHTGTAARVLQLQKRTESGGWTVTLEGRCRVHVRDVAPSSLQEMFVAAVEQLDYFTAGAPGAPTAQSGGGSVKGAAAASVGGGPFKGGRKDDGALVPSRHQEELGTRQLFMLLQGGPEGREAGARVTKLLKSQGPARVADVLGALVARDLRDRLALLATTDSSRRLELVRDGMAKLLAAASKAAGGSEGPGAAGRALAPLGAGRGRRTGLPRAFRFSDLGGGEGDDGEEEEDGKEELKALLKKLQAVRGGRGPPGLLKKLQEANPPAEVLRAAMREYKRLLRGSEQHPGYAMSLAYLETLAELPWQRWSHQAPAPQRQQQDEQQQQQQQQQQQRRQGEREGGGVAGKRLQQQGRGGDLSALEETGLSEPRSEEGQRQQQEEEEEEGGGDGGAGGGGGAERVVEPSLREVRERLDAAHYGLDKIKDRIVQYVAVQRLRGWDARAPILCFIGPPGVGKTSLARCVGDVLGRPFQRISLGGVRDEAEIRGHRRTYIGAMPGRVVQAVRKAGVRDPVLLLDEVDKMGRDARGDPAAALLEVLDPEQNHAFVDTYLGVPFDLSSVVFLSTANRAADIPPPLLDRLEVVHLAGYTLDEKLHIAARHLVPRALREHGLLPGQLTLPRGALKLLVEGYTREAGVRTLARCLAAICRHVAVQVVAERERAGGGGVAGTSGKEAASPDALDISELPPLMAAGGAASARGASASGFPVASAWGGRPAVPPQGSRVAALTAGSRGAISRHSMQGAGVPGACKASSPSPAAALQLWAHLGSLEHALQAVQEPVAKKGSGGSTARSITCGASPLGGYPWGRLQVSGQRGGSPPSSPKGQHAQQHGAGGWFSWLPWAGGSSSAAQRAEHAAELAVAAAGAARTPSGAGRAEDELHTWQQELAESSAWPMSRRLAAEGTERSMSLAGSMHSMPAQQAMLPAPPARSASSDAARLAASPGIASALPSISGSDTSGGSQLMRFGGPAAERPLPRVAAGRVLSVLEDGEEGTVQQPQQLLPLVEGLGVNPLRQVVVDEALIEEVLGPRRYTGHDNSERVASPGTTAGLVWTEVGGQVQYIECLQVGSGSGKGPGSLTLTGQLGDVLEESARIALSWVRAHAGALGLPEGPTCPATSWDVHIHLPAGAVPKDGPSAGVTLATALVSLFTGRCVRADTAMTGELTLRGLVLPVGGMKEKLLAAHTAGMPRVIVPARNMRDVQADVPREVRESLEILAAERLEDVLHRAFDPPLDLLQQHQEPRARL
ncbi:hypothetical protein N2152v2_008845 [Parachlorella kessleri]